MNISFIKGYVTKERRIHATFVASLWLKAGFALSEILAGVATYFVSKLFLLSVVTWVTKDEFAEDRNDLVANFLLHSVEHLSIGGKTFSVVYLLGARRRQTLDCY